MNCPQARPWEQSAHRSIPSCGHDCCRRPAPPGVACAAACGWPWRPPEWWVSPRWPCGGPPAV